MINNRMTHMEKAGAVNTSVKIWTGNAAAHLIFSYILAQFFYTHAYICKNTYLYKSLVNHNVDLCIHMCFIHTHARTHTCVCLYTERERIPEMKM